MKRILFTLFIILCSLGIAAQAPARRVLGDEHQTSQSPIRHVPAPQMERMPADVGVQKLIPRVPVIMVEFTDFGFTRTKAQVDSLFNAVNYNEVFPHATAKGSIRQYFCDQSMGQFQPQFDIYGPVQVSENCCAGFANYSNVRNLTKEACQLADSLIDFSQYDADGDGKIDLVYIYYAGFGRNDATYIQDTLVSNKNQLIWPHWSTTSGATFDGKQIRDYECANELDGYWTQSMNQVYPAGIGVAVHEFCHALGLPDLYPTNGTTNNFRHIGAWDIMDYGTYSDEMFCPPSLSAYERWFLGWLTPTLLNSPQNVSLGYIGETNQAYLITADGEPMSGPHSSTQAYYLLENRQKRGWDSGLIQGHDLLGHGLMITRVEFNQSAWSSNTVNNDANHQRVQLILADDDYSSSGSKWFAKPGDLFPCGATEYTAIPGFPITEIMETEDGVIWFRFMGGDWTATSNAELQQTGEDCSKEIRNGQVVIIRNNKIYNLIGQLIDEN